VRVLTTIGFIGLGIMGGPMAANLVRARFDIVGYNRTPAKADRLVERGGRAAGSVAEAVRGADVVVTVLPDSPDVEAVALGENGVFANAAPGLLYIDMSTIRPDTARAVAATGRSAGDPGARRAGEWRRAGSRRRNAVGHGRR
jgi:2-hydroxy-3-oxopropionate reductase